MGDRLTRAILLEGLGEGLCDLEGEASDYFFEVMDKIVEVLLVEGKSHNYFGDCMGILFKEIALQ